MFEVTNDNHAQSRTRVVQYDEAALQDLGETVLPQRVLIVDDDAGIRHLCENVASSMGCVTQTASNGAEALAFLQQDKPDFIFLDVNLPDCHGMELLRRIRDEYPSIRVIIITGLATVEMAVEAMKLGAYDYLRKPHIIAQFREILSRPISQPTVPTETTFCGLVGISEAMQEVFRLIDKAARTDSTVLIEGESGAGKELVARAIHSRSPRAEEPFVPIDCGAITPGLIESELFGHVSGAFTDARQAAPGLLRSAGCGTAFLDEIGELPQAVQVKLLRALQEREVRPVGSAHSEQLMARIVAATNRDLGREVALGNFRRDLFYRLHVIPIFVPPLRRRREDIPLLVERFLREQAADAGRQLSVSPEAMENLMRQDWPGNVRELENFIRRAIALLDGDVIREQDIAALNVSRIDVPVAGPAPMPPPAVVEPASVPAKRLLDAGEAEAIRTAIAQAGGNKRVAAKDLGIGLATLYRKIKKHNLPL